MAHLPEAIQAAPVAAAVARIPVLGAEGHHLVAQRLPQAPAAHHQVDLTAVLFGERYTEYQLNLGTDQLLATSVNSNVGTPGYEHLKSAIFPVVRSDDWAKMTPNLVEHGSAVR